MPLLSKYLTQARLSQVQRFLGPRVLDVGCGYGELLELLPQNVEAVVCLDRCAERLPRLRERFSKASVHGEFLQGDIARQVLQLEAGSFDTVVMAALLEHLKSPDWALKQSHRLLKPDGRLVITTPTPFGGRLHALGSLCGLTHREAAEEHERFFNERALKSLIQGIGFSLELYERFLLGLNQLLVARKP
jgi:2-polyprenyl-3-methyl-5-hydroxy-6-metoxy-1,4-benzoquinol methylase